jgi:cystathionine beta-lyase
VIHSVWILFDILTKENDGIILQTPAYDGFFKVIKQNNRKVVENKMDYDEKTGSYSINFSLLEEQLKDENNKILIFCSPQNPVGKVWSKDELEKVSLLCEKHGVFIISDEIHMDVLRKDAKHTPFFEVKKESVAVLTSASKTFNIPALLFSYAIIPNLELKEKFAQKIAARGLSSPSIFGLIALISGYNNCGYWVDELNGYLDNSFEKIKSFVSPECKITPSKATYLAWINIESALKKRNCTLEQFQELLIKESVAIMPGKNYGGETGQRAGGGDYMLRLNFGAPFSKVETGINAINSALSSLSDPKNI